MVSVRPSYACSSVPPLADRTRAIVMFTASNATVVSPVSRAASRIVVDPTTA
jgi:hypothetical protein